LNVVNSILTCEIRIFSRSLGKEKEEEEGGGGGGGGGG